MDMCRPDSRVASRSAISKRLVADILEYYVVSKLEVDVQHQDTPK